MFSHPQNNTMPAALFAAHIQHRQLCNIFPIPKPIPAAWQPCHICLRPLVFSFLTLSHPQSLSPPSSLGAAGRPWPFHCAFGMAKGWAGLRFVSSRRDDCPSCSPPNAWMSSLRRLAWLGTGAVAPWRRHSSAESLFTYPLLRLFFRICSSFSSSCVFFFFFYCSPLPGVQVLSQGRCCAGCPSVDLQSSWTFILFHSMLAPYGNYGNWIYNPIHFLTRVWPVKGLHALVWTKKKKKVFHTGRSSGKVKITPHCL